MPPGEIFIATGAFWINLDQLRAEIFSNIVYSSPATYFILVIVNVMDLFLYRRRHKEGSYWKTEDVFRIWDCTPPPPSLWEGLPY